MKPFHLVSITADQKTKQKTQRTLDNLVRKRQSVQDSVFTCYYCYYLLIALEPTITITLNRNAKQGSKPDNYSRNFICTSITIGKKVLYEDGSDYNVISNEGKSMNIIETDKNGFPVKVSEMRTKYYLDKSCRIQQHILINKINLLLAEMKFPENKKAQISFHSRKANENSVSKLLLNSFIDIDAEGKYKDIRKPITTKIQTNTEEQKQFTKLCEILNTIFLYLLDHRTGLAEQMIISDEKQSDEVLKRKCVVFTRNEFLDIVKRMRFGNEKIEEILGFLGKKEIQESMKDKVGTIDDLPKIF